MAQPGRDGLGAADARVVKYTGDGLLAVVRSFIPTIFATRASAKYRDKYAEIARRPTSSELNASWRRAEELGLKFETTTFERRNPFGMTAMFGM